MKFMLGTKQYMTQVFDEKGRAVPATVLAAGPVRIVGLRTKEKDGYVAAALGYGAKSARRATKPESGRFKDAPVPRVIREFRPRGDLPEGLSAGAEFSVGVFSVGDRVAVSAISKGKGFQGVVKRHGFAGGRRTHGQKHSEREPGSIGGGGRAGGRVVKGMRMAGRMGGERVTVKNLSVLSVDPERGELVVSGAVPGRRGTLVEVRGVGA